MSEYALLPDAPVESLDDYVAAGGGAGLERALGMDRSAVAEEVLASRLRGRGGAGFATGIKWSSVASSATEDDHVYVVCNGAEGEPGTYKDRTLMTRNPYQLLEGVLIALYAVNAEGAYVATKEKFTHEVQRLVDARDELVAAGWQGAELVRIVPGPDEYLFGEEKAMLEVVEGKLPMPRIMPPYQMGLFATMQHANPTVVNNVETLSHAARILADGGEAFTSVGTEESPGTMVFTVIGDVESPGVYEVPMGTPLRTLLCDIAGAKDILAIYSGTSNAVITPDLLDLPMDFDSFAEAGTGLGSGGFIVYDTSRDIVQICAVLARFLAIESCGQCLACKLGTNEMFERLDRFVRGGGTYDDLEELRKRSLNVTDLNRCFLPVGAALTIRSTLDAFEQAFVDHIGKPTPPEVMVQVPKINHIDHETGEVILDPEYYRKQTDWSYAPA